MARRKKVSGAGAEPPGRPWWLSPIFPVLLLATGLVMLVVDGGQPYRIWWRRGHWKRVQGTLLTSYEKHRYVRHSSGRQTYSEYLAKKPQKRIFKAVVERGWPIKRRKQVYHVHLNYTYLWRKKKHTKVADVPDRDFESRPVAERFLRQYVKNNRIRVWVNPKDPNQATAFLLYRWSALWVRVGIVVVGLALLWLFAAILLGRAHDRREKPKTDHKEAVG